MLHIFKDELHSEITGDCFKLETSDGLSFSLSVLSHVITCYLSLRLLFKNSVGNLNICFSVVMLCPQMKTIAVEQSEHMVVPFGCFGNQIVGFQGRNDQIAV